MIDLSSLKVFIRFSIWQWKGQWRSPPGLHGVRWCPSSPPSCWSSTPASTSSSTAGRTKLSGRFFSTNLDYLMVLAMVMIFTMKGDLNISSCGATLYTPLCVCLSVCPPFCVSSIYASMIQLRKSCSILMLWPASECKMCV